MERRFLELVQDEETLVASLRTVEDAKTEAKQTSCPGPWERLGSGAALLWGFQGSGTLQGRYAVRSMMPSVGLCRWALLWRGGQWQAQRGRTKLVGGGGTGFQRCPGHAAGGLGGGGGRLMGGSQAESSHPAGSPESDPWGLLPV